MRADQHRLTASERANLIAYLDGELGEEEARAIATKLTLSASARYEVERLEKAWELLEYLDRPRASDELTSRTVTLARELDDRSGAIVSVAGRTARQLLGALFAVVLTAAAVGLGFVVTRWLWPDPTARLARDLTIAERLEEYREVGSFEFLQRLDATFTESGP